jgi:serine/threonine protein kinase
MVSNVIEPFLDWSRANMSSSTKLPATRIGKYLIIQHIATGGMGTVFKAQDTEHQRVVALKVLAPEFAENPVLVERFHREAKHAARLSHKNIVDFYESGQADGFHYLAMEYVVGVDLSEYIRRKNQIDPEESRRILIQAAKALAHAYEQGIIHRDIKPSNFLLANEEGRCRVKLTDLGLSRMESEEDFRVTRAGTTVGTVDYMAPEQARDASLADVRSDIYSLGCTLYHMLAGRPPFAEGGIGERVYKHIAVDPPDIRQFNPTVSPMLWTVMRRMLSKHPDDRFQTPDELVEALRAVATSPGIPKWNEPTPVKPVPVIRPLDDSLDISPPAPQEQPVEPTPRSPSVLPTTRRSPRKTTLPEIKTVWEEQADTLGLTAEQRQAANAQFTHASEVLRTGGDLNYVRQLLISSVTLDPTTLLYRRMLREVSRDLAKSKGVGWLTSLTTLPARSRFRAARRAGDHRKALELGEELLLRLPDDLSTLMEMSDSAEELNLPHLAIWFLEDARLVHPRDAGLIKSLAALFERHKRYNQAIEMWEKLRTIDPYDLDAQSKITALAASETIARSKSARSS